MILGVNGFTTDLTLGHPVTVNCETAWANKTSVSLYFHFYLIQAKQTTNANIALMLPVNLLKSEATAESQRSARPPTRFSEDVQRVGEIVPAIHQVQD